MTDFLASHNISAQQINLDYQARVRSAQQQAEQDAAQQTAEALAAELKEEDEEEEEDVAEQKKRKRKQEKAIAKIKASKDFKKRKFEHQRDNPDESSNDDALAQSLMNKPKAPPKPGQLSNCEYCDKRFTVTPYTLSGEDGGLLCQKCSKEIKDDKKKAEAAAKKQKQQQPVQRVRKRQHESDKMMGLVEPGGKSLVEHCVSKIANVVNDIEDFGDLPQNLLDRLSQILSKKRVLTSRTLHLFLQPNIDRIAVYDCGRLESEDFEKIFAFMPDLERVNLRFAGQFKDDAIRYMIEKSHKLEHLQLGASNLVTDDAWTHLFLNRGAQLKSLKLSELNDSMKDDTVQIMAEKCTQLTRLKMRSCPHMTEVSLNSISNMKTLEHLTLAVGQTASPEIINNLITSLGPNLKTLCLEGYENTDDSVLSAIKSSCTKLVKLRLTGSVDCTDDIFTDLFTGWSNPPLSYIDLNSNRDMDPETRNDEEDENQEEIEVMGFGPDALVALFAHSGEKLEKLDLHSNRHVNQRALLEVFDGKKIYPKLSDIDFSFLTQLDDVSMAGIFKSCPQLRKLAIFACFSARQAIIPKGVAVLGLPNAAMGVEVVGDS